MESDLWSWHQLADALADGVRRAAGGVEAEQAVRGLDAYRELALHPVVHAALRDAGYGVYPEQRFPRDRGKRRRSEGSRCDLVVTPEGRPLVDEAPQLSLFAPPQPVALADALWVEIKVVAQFHESTPNRAYARALQRPVWKDVEKLAADLGIGHALVLLILFTADPSIAEHDLAVWAARATDFGLPIAECVQRAVPIGDRLGHRVCTLALFPVVRAAP